MFYFWGDSWHDFWRYSYTALVGSIVRVLQIFVLVILRVAVLVLISGTSFGSFGENCTETDLWCKTEVQMSKYLLNKLAWQCPQWLVIWDQGVADGGHSSAWSNKPTMPSATWIGDLHFGFSLQFSLLQCRIIPFLTSWDNFPFLTVTPLWSIFTPLSKGCWAALGGLLSPSAAPLSKLDHYGQEPVMGTFSMGSRQWLI